MTSSNAIGTGSTSMDLTSADLSSTDRASDDGFPAGRLDDQLDEGLDDGLGDGLDDGLGDVELVSTGTVGWVLLVAGLLGLAAAFVLAVEKYWLLTNPFYVPSCSINATISCGPVMSSPQAALFGFPNPYLGIAGFAVVAATGAMLLAGGRLAGWYLAGLQVGAVAGTVFVGWLMVQSLFVIGALCPYCMAAWAATFATVWYVTLANLGRARHRLPARLAGAADLAGRNHSAILTGWLLLVAVLVAVIAWRF